MEWAHLIYYYILNVQRTVSRHQLHFNWCADWSNILLPLSTRTVLSRTVVIDCLTLQQVSFDCASCGSTVRGRIRRILWIYEPGSCAEGERWCCLTAAQTDCHKTPSWGRTPRCGSPPLLFILHHPWVISSVSFCSFSPHWISFCLSPASHLGFLLPASRRRHSN